ncbi:MULTISPECIES: hypothetical protein [unclassified Thiocapsa]|uniref:hypothetical protein n=1 Tax=unclassified Thiocapsa TaxID=2641286 RepID=UPI0035B44355
MRGRIETNLEGEWAEHAAEHGTGKCLATGGGEGVCPSQVADGGAFAQAPEELEIVAQLLFELLDAPLIVAVPEGKTGRGE